MPWLAAVLSGVILFPVITLFSVIAPGGRFGELRGEVADEHLVGVRIYIDLLASQSQSEVGGVDRQLTANLFWGGGGFLFGGLNNFSEIVFGGLLDTGFLGFRFFFWRGLHSADLAVHLTQTILDIREALASFLAGFAGFFEGALD